MKLSTLLLSFTLIGILHYGCHKNDEVVAPGLNKPQGTLSFLLNTKRIDATEAYAYYNWDSIQKISEIEIGAYASSDQAPSTMYIGLSDDPQSSGSVTPYGISRFNKAGFFTKLMGDSAYYRSFVGSIVITRFDTLRKFISGTFEGYAERRPLGFVHLAMWGIDSLPYRGDTIHIHSGKFDLSLKVKYTEYPPK